MSFNQMKPRIAHRLCVLAIGVGALASSGARPFASGISYKVRFSTGMPNMPGMSPMGDFVIIGHGVALGSHSRLDIDSMQGGLPQQQLPFGVGDYILVLDSSRVVAVSPATKTYFDNFSMAAGGMPPDLLASASVSNVSVNVEKLGAGDTTEGRATTKYRMTSQYVMQIMGTSINMSNESDVLTVNLPTAINMPLSGSMPKSMATGPFAELYAKMNDAQKQMTGAAIRVSTTINIAGPMTMSMTQLMQFTDVKPLDVDEKLLQLPDGYAARPPSP